jgi:predicted nucleic acid-binding protein
LIYLDTCLVIYAVERPDFAGMAVRQRMADNSLREFAISPLVVMECLVGPISHGDPQLRAQYQRYLDRFVSVPIGVNVAVRAAELRTTFGLKTADALHLAAAIESGCSEFWTNDRRLSGAAGEFVVVV